MHDRITTTRATALILANKELAVQNEEKENRAAELIIANKELAFQNEEKEKRAAELIVANKELAFQNEEKERRAAELIIANKELAFQNEEKENRAAELILANKKLAFQNKEKEKRAAELILVNAAHAEKLIASNVELERYAYVVSHDLQEPLRMVTGFLQLLQKKYEQQLDETALKYINFAVDGASRMKILIHDLLEFSRITSAVEAHTVVDLNDVLSKTQLILKAVIDESKASIYVHPLPKVTGIESRLLQLFQNLISNAIKYKSNLPPAIEINYVDTPCAWQFCVGDNGIGIDEKFFDKIFIIFQRLHNREKYDGTGIGLAICKKIVELHGGRIWVESSKNESKFYFTILKVQAPQTNNAKGIYLSSDSDKKIIQ